MSLIDRFSSMRAGGINTNDATATPGDIVLGMTAYASGQKLVGTLDVGAGYDLTRIGTTVTAQAMSAIPKGGRWKGVRSTTSTTTIGSQDISGTKPYHVSSDGFVGAPNTTYSFDGGTTSLDIYFFNSNTSLYETHSVDVSSVISQFQLVSGTNYMLFGYVNEAGTLIAVRIFNTNTSTGEAFRSKLLMLEVDRETKTATPYVATFTEEITGYPLLLIKDYVFKPNGTTQYNYGPSSISLYKYNWETHTLDYLSTNSNNMESLFFRANYASYPTSLAILDDYTFLLTMEKSDSYKNRVWKISIDDVTGAFAIASAGVPQFAGSYYPFPTVSPDGHYIVASQRVGSSSYQVKIFSLNHQDMTLSELYAFQNVNTMVDTVYMSDNIIISPAGFYKFDGVTCTPISGTVSGSYNYMFRSATPIFNCYRFFMAYSGNNFFFIGSVSSQDGEYLINFDDTFSVDAGKVYGIASSAMNVGDVGNAQLLWNNINGGGS